MWIRSRGVSTCAGPYHAASSSGSVQALKTRSRGASKMCVIRTFVSVTMLFLSAQVRVEPADPGLPCPLARLHPVHGLVERLCLQPARPPLRLPAADDQPRPLEHLQVTRDRRQAHRKRLGELADRRLALREPAQDRAARRIGECSEGLAELVGRHLTARLIT